jgi:PadR family transcriptional regulator PadR
LEQEQKALTAQLEKRGQALKALYLDKVAGILSEGQFVELNQTFLQEKSRLERRPILAAKESTVYPLLRRLLGEGYLTSFWQESSQGLPPRKYYAVTERGMDYLAAMSGEWESLLEAINEIKEGTQHG